jgi:transcription elongation factor GreA
MNGKHQLTVAGLEEHKKELERLKSEDRVQNIEALKEARAQGDLSENADYDAARDEQTRIENRIKELENIIKNHVLINGKNTGNNMGRTVTVEFEDGSVSPYTLVGTLEASPLDNKISNESPLGHAIYKAKVGEKVLVKTEVSEFYVQIQSIE